jgi:TPR repeat protein
VQDQQTRYIQAVQLFKQQQYAQAADILLKLDTIPSAHALLGEIYQQDTQLKDLNKAEKHLKIAVEMGYSHARLQLGYMFEVDQQFEKAVEWYKLAADAGDSVGMTNLALLYRSGKGVEQDFKLSLQLLEKAANSLLDVSAIMELGNVYFGGIGVEKDSEKALKLFKKAADFPSKEKHDESAKASAAFNAANMFRSGHGVDKNTTEAAIWYAKAAKLGHSKAESELKMILYEYIQETKKAKNDNPDLSETPKIGDLNE